MSDKRHGDLHGATLGAPKTGMTRVGAHARKAPAAGVAKTHPHNRRKRK